ncbi:MAG TPA: glucosamine-6-phosphate deaminase [Verrucomicrobiae bacterium]|jgi:glucosamine-6-phosphate deaminase|nr:glucosamine-6-phosphate deaminase [Verrucomicrobiae bacterium]
MEIIIQPDAQTATDIAARIVSRLLREKSKAVLGLATGSTPLLLYQTLAGMKLNWRNVITFNLDEYVGLPPTHPQSYHHFMWENLFRRVNIQPRNAHIPDGMTKDIPKFCARYEKQIRAAGGIDLQLLGIGTDGHIGFNEPTSSLASRTRIKTLTQRTRQDNARHFGHVDKVPQHVITMGLGTIMEARQCVMLAFGKAKARAVAAAVEGPVSANNPASILQMHPNVKLIVDEAAASRLKRAEYYRWVYDNKPDWQRF